MYSIGGWELAALLAVFLLSEWLFGFTDFGGWVNE
jgi:hypothetical protein